MDKFDTQRRIFTINALLLLLSAVGLIIALPAIFKGIDPGIITKQAAIATAVFVCFHLLVFIGFLRGARRVRDHRPIRKKINLTAALGVGFLGIVVMDGAFESLYKALIIPVGYFTCVICDYASAIVSVVAHLLLRPKKKN